jgi:hypothetical protein
MHPIIEGNKLIRMTGDALRACDGRYTVPENITEIGPGAFKDLKELKTISMPFMVKIKKDAFKGCTNLTSVKIQEGPSDNGVWLESGAFEDCVNLKAFDCPVEGFTIELDAFKNCRNLELQTVNGRPLDYNASSGQTSLNTASNKPGTHRQTYTHYLGRGIDKRDTSYLLATTVKPESEAFFQFWHVAKCSASVASAASAASAAASAKPTKPSF